MPKGNLSIIISKVILGFGKLTFKTNQHTPNKFFKDYYDSMHRFYFNNVLFPIGFFIFGFKGVCLCVCVGGEGLCT